MIEVLRRLWPIGVWSYFPSTQVWSCSSGLKLYRLLADDGWYWWWAGPGDYEGNPKSVHDCVFQARRLGLHRGSMRR